MSKNRIAAALRAMTAAPSLESEDSAVVTGDGDAITTAPVAEAQTDQAEVAGEDVPATGVVVDVDNGPENIEAAETTSEDAENLTTSTENEDASDSSVVTGDGDQTMTQKLEDAQTDQADVEGEDKPLTGKTVEVDDGPKEESAVTEVVDSIPDDVMGVPSQESLTLAAAGFALVGGIAAAVLGHKAERANMERVKLEELLERKKKALEASQEELTEQVRKGLAKAKREKPEAVKETDITGFGIVAGMSYTMWLTYIFPFVGTLISVGVFTASSVGAFKKVKKLGEEIAEIEKQIAERQVEILMEAGNTKISNESEDGSAEAAAAFAAGAAGAAEAAAQAAGSETPEVVEDAAAEVAEAEAAAEVAEDQAAEAEAVAEVVEVPEDVKEAEEIAAGDEEIGELEADIAEGEEHIEKFEEASATLESLHDAIVEAQQSGGLTPQAAKFMNIGFESVGVFLTGAPFKNARGEDPMPSMESFGGTMRRDEATNISLENVKEWWDKVVEVLRNTWKMVKDWVVKFVKAVLDQGERYIQRAEKIKAKAAEISGSPEKDTVSFRGASKIAVGPKVKVESMDSLLKLAESAGYFAEGGAKIYAELEKAFADVVAKAGDEEPGALVDKFRELSARFGGDDSNTISSMLRSAAFEVGNNDGETRYYSTRTLPGNIAFKIEFDHKAAAGEAEGEGNVAKVKAAIASLMARAGAFRLETEQLNQQGDEVDAEQKTLTKSEIETVATKVKDIVTRARHSSSLLQNVKSDFSIRAGSDVGVANRAVIAGAATMIGGSIRRQASNNSKLLKYSVTSAGVYLDYAIASLRAHGVSVGALDATRDAARGAADKAGEAARSGADAVRSRVGGGAAEAAA